MISCSKLVPLNYFQPLLLKKLFPEVEKIEIDLGCGGGEYLTELAQDFPTTLFIGIERLQLRAEETQRKIEALHLPYAKIFQIDGEYAIKWLFSENSINRIHCLFPDPWPKNKHRKKQLIQKETICHFSRILRREGDFLLQTDDEKYFSFIQKQFEAHPSFSFAIWPEFIFPKTRFREIWEEEGRTIYRLRAVNQK